MLQARHSYNAFQIDACLPTIAYKICRQTRLLVGYNLHFVVEIKYLITTISCVSQQMEM